MLRPLTLLVLAACAGDPPDAADYDAACMTPEDCVLVVQNGYCGACDGMAALSTDGAALFLDDQEAYGEPHCRVTILPGCSPVDLTLSTATCEAQVCGFSAVGG
jgi:hypothetical protein